ncbi:hypothetical protein Zm00014a_024833, partial [Zea mays]
PNLLGTKRLCCCC